MLLCVVRLVLWYGLPCCGVGLVGRVVCVGCLVMWLWCGCGFVVWLWCIVVVLLCLCACVIVWTCASVVARVVLLLLCCRVVILLPCCFLYMYVFIPLFVLLRFVFVLSCGCVVVRFLV